MHIVFDIVHFNNKLNFYYKIEYNILNTCILVTTLSTKYLK